MVDLGGSLAVASMGLYATGVSTDMNSQPPHYLHKDGMLMRLPVTYLNSGGNIGDKIQASAVCEKSESPALSWRML